MKEKLISNYTKKSLVLIMVLALAFTLVPMVPVGDVVNEAEAVVTAGAHNVIEIGDWDFYVTQSNIYDDASCSNLFASEGNYVKLDTSASNILATNVTTYSNTYINDNEGIYLRVANGEIEVILNHANIHTTVSSPCIYNDDNTYLPLKVVVASKSTLTCNDTCIESVFPMTITGEELILSAGMHGLLSCEDCYIYDSTITASVSKEAIGSEGHVVITNSDINILNCDCGIYSEEGNIDILNSTVFASASSVGIISMSGNVTVTDSDIEIIDGIDGIWSTQNIVFNNEGHTVTISDIGQVTNPPNCLKECALHSNNGSVILSGGKYTLTSQNSDGIYAGNDISISDGIVDIKAGHIGMQTMIDSEDSSIFISGGTVNVVAGHGGVCAGSDIIVSGNGKISATVTNGNLKSTISNFIGDGSVTNSSLDHDQFGIGMEFCSGAMFYKCIKAAKWEASQASNVHFLQTKDNGIKKQASDEFVSLDGLSSASSSNTDSATDIIFSTAAGNKITLYGSSSPVEDTPAQPSPQIGYVEKYIEADDGTLLPESKVYFYNEALHQKEVAQIQNDVKSWRVTVRTTLAKKGIKLYAYLNGFDTEELYSYLDKGYTVQYDWYKAAGKNKKYKYIDSRDNNYFYDKDVKTGKTYFYKCKITIYDENGKIVRTMLKDCKYGCRKFK